MVAANSALVTESTMISAWPGRYAQEKSSSKFRFLCPMTIFIGLGIINNDIN